MYEHVERRLQQLGACVFQEHVASGHRDGHGVGAGLDAVGQHAVARAIELRHALDHDARGPRAADFGPHLVEAIRDVGDLGLARRVLDHARAARERSRHQRRVGAADGHLGKLDVAAPEAISGASDDVAAIGLDIGAQTLERHDQQIDRPRADRAAARHGHSRFPHARHQWRDDPKARAHAGNELIGSRGVDDIGGRDVQRLAVVLRFPAALAVDHDVDAVIAQDALEQIDVGEARDIVENECLVGEQARDHQRQGGILCAGDRDRSIEPLAAVNANAIHAAPLDPKRRPKTRPLLARFGPHGASSARDYSCRQFRRNREAWRLPAGTARHGFSPAPCAA